MRLTELWKRIERSKQTKDKGPKRNELGSKKSGSGQNRCKKLQLIARGSKKRTNEVPRGITEVQGWTGQDQRLVQEVQKDEWKGFEEEWMECSKELIM